MSVSSKIGPNLCYSTGLGVPEGRYIAPANSADCIQVKAGDCAPRSVLLLTPWFNRVDLGVMKKIGIGGTRSVELRFDFLNVFDTPNYNQESFAAGREQLFRNAIEGLLAQLTPADRAMVAALPFGGVMVPFTSDIARIRLAAGRVTGQGSRVETGSDLACRTRRFLESLEGLLRTQATQASPQTLIVFTAGLAAPRRDAPMGILPGMCELLVDLFRHVGTVASAARANVYVMQPEDIGIGTSLPRPTAGGVGDIGSDNPLEGIEHLAGVTGGTRLPLDATGTASLLRVARESSAYYVAELEPVRGEVFGRSRALGVRVARRGVIVRGRPEITFTDTAQPRSTRLVVTDVLASTEAATDLGLRVGGFTVRDAEGKLRVGVLVEPADSSVGLAAAGAILIEGNGRVAAHWNARDATERPLLGAMTVPGGIYRVRAAAIDTSGRAGAAEAEIEVGLTEVGGLSLGSLLLGISRSGTTFLQLEFGSEPTARASFDIYGGTAGQRLSATLELSRDLDSPAITAVPLALTRADDTRVVATGTVRSERCRRATTSCAASSGSRTEPPDAS